MLRTNEPQPFVSIGVTTYNRKQFLTECLESIVSQDFQDFEVIVGNDFTREHLTYRELGIKDQRIRIINNVENLGEAENMRMLLRLARGKYFTWIADDEVYMPTFLSSVVEALTEDNVLVVYTNVMTGSSYTPTIDAGVVSSHQLLTGQEFLSKWLDGSIHAQGNYGVFKRSYIESIGWRKLGDGFEGSLAWGPYSDWRLLLLSGSLPKVAYIESPKIFMRIHLNSISNYSADLNAYISGQKDLFKVILPTLRMRENRQDIEQNVTNLFETFVDHFFIVLNRGKGSRWKVSLRYGFVLFRLIKGERKELRRVRNHILWKYANRHLREVEGMRYGGLMRRIRRYGNYFR